MKKTTTALCFIVANMVFAGMTQEQESGVVTGFKLQLGQEAYLTDVYGKADPARIVQTPIGKSVRIYRADGFCYTGTVTEIEDGETYFKIYGTINNVPDTRFGFVLAKGGIFAGAVVEKENEKTYALEYSEAHKGYVLCRSTKYNKQGA